MVKSILLAALSVVMNRLQPNVKPPTAPLSRQVEYSAQILEVEPTRPNYAWGVVQGALLANAIGIPRISVLELGVAGGNGLIALEKIAAKAAELCGVEIDVYGFDTGTGLPKPSDYRDLPNMFREGFFPMNVGELQKRLTTARPILGDVKTTIPDFLSSAPAPIAFVSFDLDLYTSTAQALQLFEAHTDRLMPRIFCYFDDIMGFSYGDFNGERLAISEFNDSHTLRKLSKIYGMQWVVPAICSPSCWIEQFYMAHIFDHGLYGRYDGSNPRTRLDLGG